MDEMRHIIANYRYISIVGKLQHVGRNVIFHLYACISFFSLLI